MKVANIFVETYNLVEGYHKWAAAPSAYAYLRKVYKEDRDLEINDLQTKIAEALIMEFGAPMQLENRSCEHLAHWLLEEFADMGMVQATVLEDGYGGATLSR